MIVEDDDQTRARFIDKIASCSGLSVVSEAASCAEARAQLPIALPDVLLVDLGLPDGDGADIILQASQLANAPAIMVITVFGDEQRVLRAIRSGASGYLLKSDTAQDICASIDELLKGGAPISPVIARYLIRHFQEKADPQIPEIQSTTLSERELEVLRLAAKGYTYQEVADLLGISVNTVGTHTRVVYRKLAVGSRSEALFEATRLGLVSVPRQRD